MDEPASIGYWVRHRRKALDLTQADLARKVGCAEVTIQKIEADERRPSAQIATLLAEQLQIPPDERAAFLSAARGELIPERSASPATATRPSSRAARTSAPPHNLPSALTSFVGRTRELATTAAMLAETRLLTLTGPGGSGKTRLALELAGAVLEQFPGGVWLVELAPLADAMLIVPAIAAVLQVREDPGRPLLTTLTTYLRERRPLLILDNCEHLIDACAQVSTTLLQACPRLRILASSREPLGVAGESFFRVPALTVPDPHQLPPLEQLGQYEAVQLFVARAGVGQTAFALTATTAAPLAQICARLDGIPLAIELAAARVRMLPLAQIAARLDDRFHLLTGGSRTAVPRQQTLQALIDWSYDLLPEEERALLRRLAVFVGGWTLEAAEAITTLNVSTFERSNVLDGLGHLVDKSLVEVEPGEETARYRMLETIRQYALERLAASGEKDALRRRHASYFRDAARSYISQRDRARGITPESDNLRAALAWSQSAVGDPALALDLAHTLALAVFMRGDSQGARRLLAQALEYAEGLIDTQRYAEASLSQGIFIGGMGDLVASRALFEQSYMLYQKLGDKSGEADALERLGWVAREQGDAITARIWLAQSIALCHDLGNKQLLLETLTTLAEVAVLEEDAASAETLLDESLALNREYNNQNFMAWTLNHLGHAAQLRGDYDRAAQLHAESLALFIDLLGEKNYALTWVWQSLGETALAQGNLATARNWLTAALRLCCEMDDRVASAWCLAGLGSAAALDEQPERAARLWGAAERLRTALGCRPAPAARATYERAVALACAQLGDEAFSAAWAAGAALSLDQAIAFALEPVAEVPTPGPALAATPKPAIAAAEYPAGLTAREVEVLRLVAQGLTDAQVAERLVVSVHTIHAHLRSIYGKLEVTSRTAASRFAVDHHLI